MQKLKLESKLNQILSLRNQIILNLEQIHFELRLRSPIPRRLSVLCPLCPDVCLETIWEALHVGSDDPLAGGLVVLIDDLVSDWIQEEVRL